MIGKWIRTFENFQTVGRNGLHRYNNQDHSMLSAMYAARNVLGGEYDVWNVNVERSYHEKMEVEDKPKKFKAVRATPELADQGQLGRFAGLTDRPSRADPFSYQRPPNIPPFNDRSTPHENSASRKSSAVRMP